MIPKKVKHIMRRGVVTVGPETTLSEAAATMAKRKIGALPVLKGGKLVGIVTATDLLHYLAKLAAESEKQASEA